MVGTAYRLLVSPKLAIALLIVVLTCCVLGTTVVRGARAGELIFSTLWFNGLLVLLAVSSAAAFFSRTWKRRLTLVSVGMILFHLSFAAILGGIVYNRLFFFDGSLRLTEGETLPNGRPESYDRVAMGRFFDFSTLRGETTLVALHVDYRVGGENKRAAYEIAIDDGASVVRGTIWVTEYLDADGVRYFCEKEGYSVLLVMSDPEGKELYGAYVPLQSYPAPGDNFSYAAGTLEGPSAFAFPPQPRARVAVDLAYRPSSVTRREGDVTLGVRSLRAEPTGSREEAPVKTGTVQVGGSMDAGGVRLSPREIRYWVGMNVRYDPGLVVILSSLTLGLLGMVLTFAGRMRQGAARRRAE